MRVLSIAFLALASIPAMASDLTLTTAFEFTGSTGRSMPHSSILMIHGQRSRAPGQSYVGDRDGNKMYGPRFATIQQCDLRQTITVDLDNQVYSVFPLPKSLTRAEYEAAAAEAQHRPLPAETLTITTDVKDTGETKLIFGRVARHYKIHTEREPSAGANANAREDFTDGWYIDVPEYQQLRACSAYANLKKPGTQHAVVIASSSSQPMNYRIVQKTSGAAMIGDVAADALTTTHEWVKHPDGSVREVTSTSREMIAALSTDPLDPGLFDVPLGYARVSEVRTGPKPTWTYQAEVAWVKFWNKFGF